MPILTKNQTPAKGQKAEFQLDKAALAALPSVAADSYFSDSANWSHVEIFYKSDTGNQFRVVKFDTTQLIPLSSFYVSLSAKDVFLIQKIVINDFDGDEFKLTRNQLTVAEFDIDMTPPPIGDFLMAENGDFIAQEDGHLINL